MRLPNLFTYNFEEEATKFKQTNYVRKNELFSIINPSYYIRKHVYYMYAYLNIFMYDQIILCFIFILFFHYFIL